MSNAEAALRYCREAEQAAAAFDRDAFVDGRIARCVARAEMNLISQLRYAACQDFARALAALQAVRADHPRQGDVRTWVAEMRADRAKLGC